MKSLYAEKPKGKLTLLTKDKSQSSAPIFNPPYEMCKIWEGPSQGKGKLTIISKEKGISVNVQKDLRTDSPREMPKPRISSKKSSGDSNYGKSAVTGKENSSEKFESRILGNDVCNSNPSGQERDRIRIVGKEEKGKRVVDHVSGGSACEKRGKDRCQSSEQEDYLNTSRAPRRKKRRTGTVPYDASRLTADANTQSAAATSSVPLVSAPARPLYSSMQEDEDGDQIAGNNSNINNNNKKRGPSRSNGVAGSACFEGYHNNIYNGKKRVASCPPGELEVMVASLATLAASLTRKSHRNKNHSEAFIGFMKRHQYGDETVSGLHKADGAVQFVLLNFPSGLHVNGIDDEVVPPWNVATPNLISNGLAVAGKIVCDSGWVACVHTVEQHRQVEDAAMAAHLVLLRSFTLFSNIPIYYKLVQPNDRVHTVVISVFHRRGVPIPKAYYVQAGQMGHGECSLSRDLVMDKTSSQDWVCKADGTPWRGGAQRSESIWKFLVLAFTKYGDSVVDLIAGTGGFIKIASDLGRHALGAEADEHIVDQLLRPLTISIQCDECIHRGGSYPV